MWRHEVIGEAYCRAVSTLCLSFSLEASMLLECDDGCWDLIMAFMLHPSTPAVAVRALLCLSETG